MAAVVTDQRVWNREKQFSAVLEKAPQDCRERVLKNQCDILKWGHLGSGSRL